MWLQVTLLAFLAVISTHVNAAPSKYIQVKTFSLHPVLIEHSNSQKRGVNFNWGSEKVRGVNLGGWLVLEP